MAIVGIGKTFTTTGSGTVQVLGPNPNRVGLMLSIPSTNSYFFKLGEDAANNDGIRVQGGSMLPVQILFDKPNLWIASYLSIYTIVAETISIVEFVERPG